MNHEATEKVIARARELVKQVLATPPHVAQAGGEAWRGLDGSARALSRAIERHYDSLRPPELRLLPAWIMAAAPDEAWWGRLGDTRAGFVCDGRCLLVIDECPDAPLKPSSRFRDRFDADRRVARLFDAAKLGTRVTVRREHLEVTTEHLKIGPTLLDARRIDRWVLPAACIPIADSIVIDTTYASARDPVMFAGAGWRALVMAFGPTDRADRPSCTTIETGASR